VHYIDPHAPYFAHEEFLKIFEEDNLWRENNTKLDANPEADADSYESRGFIPKIVFTQGKYLASYYIASYDAEVCYTDSQIGRLLGILPENTLVILTADHGESMGEHNIYFSHGENIYDELLHVPLIIRDSTYFRGGKRIAETVSSLDIVPTVLSRVNPFWFIFNRGTFNGRDLNRILENKHPKPKYIFAYKPDVYSIRDIDRNIKYILEDAVKEELYFLPDENNNFIGEDSSDVNSIKNELRTNLLTWLEEHPLRSDIHPGNTLPDKEAQENLKSLGYIQ
jgi:hypothetical protein